MPKKEDVMRGRRTLHNDELHDFHSSVYRYSTGMIKSNRKYVARTWKKESGSGREN